MQTPHPPLFLLQPMPDRRTFESPNEALGQQPGSFAKEWPLTRLRSAAWPIVHRLSECRPAVWLLTEQGLSNAPSALCCRCARRRTVRDEPTRKVVPPIRPVHRKSKVGPCDAHWADVVSH